ncbi:hypothetical protein [Sphingorhabdus sp.]|uniref:hypothetical protein n=1 Tax=Sphingorhabdus sp. TaxID=1902408 RepID=UPI0033403104
MPTYTVRAPNGKSYKITGPAGATNAQIEKAVLEAYPDAGGAAPQSTAQRALSTAKTDAQARLAQARRSNDKSAEQTYSREVARLNKMTPQQFYKAPGRAESFVSGLVEGVTDPIKLGLDLFGIGGDKAQRERGTFRLRESQKQFPVTTGTGEVIGNILATAPGVAGAGRIIQGGGKLLSKVLPKAGASLQRVGTATRTGGIGSGRTAAQTAALTRGQRGLQLAERSVGGALGAVAAEAQLGGDLTEAATFGAGLPVVANVLKRVGGKAVDLTRLSKVKAGQIIRESLGENVEAAKTAFRALLPDDQRLAQQVLIEAGVEPSPYFGLGAIAAREIDPDTPQRILAAQELARDARLADISGGADATARRAATDVERRAVNEATGPAREAALGTIKETNVAVSEAERLANAARQQAAEQSGLARRMTFGAERAETRLGQMDDLGDVFDPAAVARERGIAGAMTQRGEQAALGAIDLRQQARSMDDIVAELAAQNREPLLAAPLANTLRQQAGAEGVRTSSARRALLKLASQIEGAADQNGMLNPYDLYTLRKEASDIVEKYVASAAQPSTGSKKRAAGLVIGFKNAVDEALGPEFKDYLVQHQRGMQNVNTQELASKGAQLAKESLDEFIALMRRDRPKIVEDVYGKGTNQYDIAGMALADPRRYNAMKMSADELQNLNRMGELALLGETRAGNILKEQQPGKLSKFAGTIVRAKYPALAFAGTGAQGAGSAIVTPGVQRGVANAFTSGRNALAAIEQYPTATQISEYISSLPSPVRNAFAQAMRAYATQPSSNQ